MNMIQTENVSFGFQTPPKESLRKCDRKRCMHARAVECDS